MKKTILIPFLLAAAIVNAQPIVQPISSGDYWQIDQWAAQMPRLATKTTFPLTVQFTNGYIGINNLSANRLVGENEIVWNIGAWNNAANFVVEWSRDAQTFQQAGVVHLESVNGGRYVFRHRFEDNRLVYYRIGIVTGANTIAYSPAVQVAEEEYTTKIFPTEVKGSTFYIQTGQAFEKLQVVNSAGQAVYEKGISGQTGTITIGLPPLNTGVYFVRLLSGDRPQHVQRIVVG
ncbi:T9SS type A sorting domain-containing protein [Flavisolibacter ginsenosidimutans]|nr:T9SS type A sorting domain-containing protein [Flavisolibacter ginsenosidimutans]